MERIAVRIGLVDRDGRPRPPPKHSAPSARRDREASTHRERRPVKERLGPRRPGDRTSTPAPASPPRKGIGRAEAQARMLAEHEKKVGRSKKTSLQEALEKEIEDLNEQEMELILQQEEASEPDEEAKKPKKKKKKKTRSGDSRKRKDKRSRVYDVQEVEMEVDAKPRVRADSPIPAPIHKHNRYHTPEGSSESEGESEAAFDPNRTRKTESGGESSDEGASASQKITGGGDN